MKFFLIAAIATTAPLSAAADNLEIEDDFLFYGTDVFYQHPTCAIKLLGQDMFNDELFINGEKIATFVTEADGSVTIHDELLGDRADRQVSSWQEAIDGYLFSHNFPSFAELTDPDLQDFSCA